MITLELHYNNRTEYQVWTSEWATIQIAIQLMKQDLAINYCEVVNQETCEVITIPRK